MASVVQIRSSQPIPKAVRDSSRYAQHGLALPATTLRALKKRGIYCQSSVTLEFQQLARRYVLRGVESGGAVVDMGRYCAYLNREGEPLPWLQPIDSLGVNGRHALVIAEEFVRIDMLRIGRTYEMVITHHDLVFLPDGTRPRVGSRVLFRGQQGTLAIETWRAENKDLRGEIAPVFYSLAGEIRKLPDLFEGAVRRVSGAVSCIGCKHCHIATTPPLLPAASTPDEAWRKPEQLDRGAVMEMTFAEIADVNRRERPRLCRCVDSRGYPIGSCSVCDGGGGVQGCHTCSGGGMLPAERGAMGLCTQCKGKGYLAHRFPREALTKAAQLRKQRAKKG